MRAQSHVSQEEQHTHALQEELQHSLITVLAGLQACRPSLGLSPDQWQLI